MCVVRAEETEYLRDMMRLEEQWNGPNSTLTSDWQEATLRSTTTGMGKAAAGAEAGPGSSSGTGASSASTSGSAGNVAEDTQVDEDGNVLRLIRPVRRPVGQEGGEEQGTNASTSTSAGASASASFESSSSSSSSSLSGGQEVLMLDLAAAANASDVVGSSGSSSDHADRAHAHSSSSSSSRPHSQEVDGEEGGDVPSTSGRGSELPAEYTIVPSTKSRRPVGGSSTSSTASSSSTSGTNSTALSGSEELDPADLEMAEALLGRRPTPQEVAELTAALRQAADVHAAVIEGEGRWDASAA